MNVLPVCRMVREEDKSQVQTLWTQCFDDTPDFVQWYFLQYYRTENTLGIFGGTHLLASAQVIPYCIKLRGNKQNCGYIVGVDTAPEARNRGYARTLLHSCLKLQRERKQFISLLMPFEGQFYYRYGWSFSYFHQQLLLHPSELRCAAKAWGSVREIELENAVEILHPLYDSFAKNYDGMVMREKSGWNALLADAALEQTRCYVLEQEGQAVGYCLWTPMKSCSFIREMVWCCEEARAGLLEFIRTHVPDGNQVWLELPDEDVLVYQLAASKKAAVRYPFLMARIVDVQQCLEAIRYPDRIVIAFCMAVQDSFAEWNDAVFEIQIAHGCARVNLLKEKTVSEADVLVTIDGLSQLVMGSRSVSQLMRQNLLQTTEALSEVLQKLWPIQNLYINEYY